MPSLPDNRKPGRQDPKTRHQIGTREGILRNARPDRHYVWAAKAGSGGAEEYEELGYEYERHGAKPGEGTSVVGHRNRGSKPGDPIEFKGHVLMSIDIAEWRARRAAEQAEFDPIEQQIVTQRHGLDPLRGLGTVRRGEMALEAPGQDFSV